MSRRRGRPGHCPAPSAPHPPPPEVATSPAGVTGPPLLPHGLGFGVQRQRELSRGETLEAQPCCRCTRRLCQQQADMPLIGPAVEARNQKKAAVSFGRRAVMPPTGPAADAQKQQKAATAFGRGCWDEGIPFSQDLFSDHPLVDDKSTEQ